LLILWIGLSGGCAQSPEVIVVGGGPAGLAAAWELSSGSRVTLLEAQTELGGTARSSQAITAIEGGGSSSPLLERTTRMIEWTKTFDVQWTKVPDPSGQGHTLMAPQGGGLHLMRRLEHAARQRGVTIRTASRVTDLSAGKRWTVHLSNKQTLEADAVVLATGGPMGNLPWVKKHLNLGATPLLRGAPLHADGNGISMAIRAGASLQTPQRALLYAHGVPHPRHPSLALMLLQADQAYTVDVEGRYLPEAQSPRGPSGDALRKRPRAQGWAILDGWDLDTLTLWDVDRGDMHRARKIASQHDLIAPTLSALAKRLAIPEERLEDGIYRSNEPDPAHPLKMGRDFGALPLRLTTGKSLSGLNVDPHSRLMNASGQPIDGLYAAGELIGFGFLPDAGVMDSTMVAGSLATGRQCGRSALEDLRQKKPW